MKHVCSRMQTYVSNKPEVLLQLKRPKFIKDITNCLLASRIEADEPTRLIDTLTVHLIK
jgi:hypothetical protein